MNNSTLSKIAIRTESNRKSTIGWELNHRFTYQKFEKTLALIGEQQSESLVPWYVGFSGGKDSSLLLKLVFLALKKYGQKVPVSIIYCDTKVEIPILRGFVDSTLSNVASEAESLGLDIRVIKAQPKLSDGYFVKVIGNGYPPPTNKFRWCTKRLRVAPVKTLLAASNVEKGVILLGVRKGESVQRDRTLLKHASKTNHYFTQAGYSNLTIFAPIVDYSTTEVWEGLALNGPPRSISFEQLKTLYKDAGGECPIIKDPEGTPCGKGRFGCWTCTVVRKDKATRNLVLNGHSSLKPLLEFRSWLLEIRNDATMRCARRRNGALGPGPFTLGARRRILARLLETQSRVPWELISEQEVQLIHKLWEIDMNSQKYKDSAIADWALDI